MALYIHPSLGAVGQFNPLLYTYIEEGGYIFLNVVNSSSCKLKAKGKVSSKLLVTPAPFLLWVDRDI